MGATYCSLASRRIYGHRERECAGQSFTFVRRANPRRRRESDRRRRIGSLALELSHRAPNEIARDDVSRSRSSYEDGNETRIARRALSFSFDVRDAFPGTYRAASRIGGYAMNHADVSAIKIYLRDSEPRDALEVEI